MEKYELSPDGACQSCHYPCETVECEDCEEMRTHGLLWSKSIGQYVSVPRREDS